MKSVIYYFSATGNSQHIAYTLQKELKSEVLPMVGHEHDVCSCETIGFVFPTFFWGIPHIVKDFIINLEIKAKNPYIFAISNCYLMSGASLGMVKENLENRSLVLSYGNVLYSVGNYIAEYNINLDKVEKRLHNVELDTKKMAQDILNKKTNHIRKPFYFDRAFYNLYEKRRMQDNFFSIDKTCVSCGTCQNVCPVKNIILENGKPEFKHHCEHCFACVHWCPKKAIQYQSKTIKKNRYHNPNISVNKLNK